MPDQNTLAKARALIEAAGKATAGPWAIERCGEKGDGSNMIGVVFNPAKDPDCNQPLAGWLPACDEAGEFIEYYVDEAVAELEHRNRNSGRDATFIATARNDAPAIAEALIEAVGLLKRLTALPPEGAAANLKVFMEQSMIAKDDARNWLQKNGEAE